MECIIYHLLLVVVVWLVKMLKIVEKLGGLYDSATIASRNSNRLFFFFTQFHVLLLPLRIFAQLTVSSVR